MSNLPNGYTQVEYIKATGVQYINTGVLATATTEVDIQYSYETSEIYGMHFLSTVGFYTPFPKPSANHFFSNRLGNENGLNIIPEVGHIYTVRAYTNNTVVIDGVTYTGFTCGAITTTTPLYMFAYAGNPGSGRHSGTGNIYYCKIYNNGVLVRDFIPCISDTNAIGMYDLVENKFYGNNGTGTFVAGEVVSHHQHKYLIADENKLYTVVDGALLELATTDIVAQTFLDYGIEDIPDGALLVGLSNPEVLYWQDSEDDLPTLTATVTATPPPQTVISSRCDLSDATITGIENMLATCEGELICAVSFDDKATWKAHNGVEWVTLSDEYVGMSKETLEAITLEQWNELYLGASGMYIRIALTDATQVLTKIEVDFSN